ncbi:tetratricopeptide repeat protein [Mesonia aquimarina]|uniref:tetratricopeptide repeat protein n=1 Tax=Mesonia aquimarina TaxID=1504967 RepID=UPI000EF561F3|nr:tetratricopeptide repeat protein [Mesonia aquimarina]
MKYKLLLFLIFFFFSFCFYSQDEKKFSSKECQELLNQGIKAYEDHNYSEALKKLTKAEVIIQNKSCDQELWYVQNFIGNVYKISTNYAEGLEYYLKALENSRKEAELNENTATVLTNIGALYYQTNEKLKALMYYEEAYELAKKIDSDYNKVFAGLNIADIYNKKGELDKALKYLNEIKNLDKSDFFQRIWEVNYADNFYYRGEITNAKHIAEKLLEKNKEKDVCHVCVLELLAKISEKQKDTKKAIAYTEDALQYTVEWKSKIEKYKYLADLYQEEGSYLKSLQYKDSAMLAKDSLAARINKQLFAVNKVKLEVQEYENDLKTNLQKQKAERKMFILLIIFIVLLAIIIGFIIYKGFKNKIAKQKQAKTIIESKQKIIKLELEKEKSEHQALKDQSLLQQEQLKNKIGQKNRKLSAKALYLSDRDKLIEGIIDSLTQIPEIVKNKEVNDDIRSLKEHLKADAEWDEFIEHFEKVNPEFLKTLNQKHAKLSENDIRFLCYIYMNLDVKEISLILNITIDASRKRKQRIAKKMGINVDKLHYYVLNIQE